MIKNNNFYLNELKTVVFIGYSPIFEELIKINDKKKIETIIITSSDQAKNISKKIKFHIFDEINEKFKKFINKNTQPEKTLFFSISARIIFNKNIIEQLFLNNLVNTHGTRLPLGRGEVLSWRILKEDRLDNLCIHLVDDKIDTGPIIFSNLNLISKEFQLPSEIQNFTIKKFKDFYEAFINKIIKKEKLPLKHQPEYLSSYLPRLSTDDNGWIDWSLSPREILRFINAFDEPYAGASTFINRKGFGRLRIKSAQLHGGEVINHSFMSGIVIRHDHKWIVVALSKYSLIIEKVIDEKKNNILEKIKLGDRFYTPNLEIYNSKKFRAFFNSKGIKKN